MASAWDKAPEARVQRKVILSDGGTFIGKVKKVEFITIPKGTFNNQPTDLTEVPMITFDDRQGNEREFEYVGTVARNAILNLKPEIGTWVFNKRIGRATGKGYVDGTYREATPEEVGAPQPAPKSAAPKAAAKVGTEPDF
jgi:hypothetical protein